MVKQFKSMMWVSHQKVATEIEWFIPKDEDLLYNQPIYILDADPELCASYLTTFHIKQYIEYIVYSTIAFRCTEHTTLNKAKISGKPRVDYMYYSQRNMMWFSRLYFKMQEIYKYRHGKYYKVNEYFKEEWLHKFDGVTGPMDRKHRAHKAMRMVRYTVMIQQNEYYFEPYKKTLKKVNMHVPSFRLMYMLMGYLNSEFPAGAPAWYSCMRATIWKSYNRMTRLYYRIDTSIDGVYTYFYSVDGNAWKEIQNIPMELRGLIDGIIFAREV